MKLSNGGKSMKIINIIKQRKYLSRIFLLVMSSILISVCIFSIIINRKMESNLLRKEFENNSKVLSQMEYNIDMMNKAISNLCLSIYSSADVVTMMYGKNNDIGDLALYINRLNSSILNVNDNIHSIYVYNNYEKVYYSTLNNLVIDDIELKNTINIYGKIPPRLKPIPRKSPFVTGSSTDNSSVFSFFYYDALDSSRQMDGALVMNVKSGWIYDNIKIINNIGGKSKGEVLILDDREQFIDFGGKEGLSANQEIRQELIAEYRTNKGGHGNKGYYFSTIGKMTYLVTYLKIENINWVLLNIQGYNEVYRDIHELRNYMYVIALIFLIIAIVISATISGGIYRPVGRLIKKYGFWNPGEAGPVKARDEISFLNAVYMDFNNQLEEYKKEKSMSRDILKKYFLKRLLTDSTSLTEDETAAGRKEHGLSLELKNRLAVCIIKIDETGRSKSKLEEKEKEIITFAIANIACEIISKKYANEQVNMNLDFTTIIISVQDEDNDYFRSMQEYAKEIQGHILLNFSECISIVLSEVTDNVTHLSRAYNEAVNLLQYRFILGHNSIITPAAIEKNKRNQKFIYSTESEIKFINEIKTGNLKAAEQYLSVLLEEISELSYNNIILSLIQLTNKIQKAIEEINHTRLVPVHIDMKSILANIGEMGSIIDFRESILDTVKSVIQQTKNGENEKHRILVDAIKEIVNSNYQDSGLCSQQIASMLKLSSFHIRDVFRSNTGMSISEYLNEVRLEKAVEWFNNSTASIGDVMHKVGMENESYFYKL